MEGRHMQVTDPADLAEAPPIPSSPATAGYRLVEFTSDGASLRGRFYLPDRQPAGVVAMAHGFSATIPMVMDRYAECFRKHGLAVFAFDRASEAQAAWLVQTLEAAA
jgi:hypothetical protein